MALITKLLTACAIILPVFTSATEKFNIVWIISDGLSPELGCYDKKTFCGGHDWTQREGQPFFAQVQPKELLTGKGI